MLLICVDVLETHSHYVRKWALMYLTGDSFGTHAVWYGVLGGVGVSIIFGVIFIALYYTAQSNLFKGTNRDWFKGIISWIAAALITYLGFAMLRFIGWEDKWKRRLEAAVQKEVCVLEITREN